MNCLSAVGVDPCEALSYVIDFIAGCMSNGSDKTGMHFRKTFSHYSHFALHHRQDFVGITNGTLKSYSK